MNIKLIALVAFAIALVGCGGETDNSLKTTNTAGSVAISGTATVDEDLSADITDANGYLPSNVTYSWFADGVLLEDQESSTLGLSEDEEGAVITVSVSYTDNDGFPEQADSAGTEPVAGIPPTNEGASVAITGAAQETKTLTATVTDPDGVSGAITYQWAADGTDIAGATTSTFVLTNAQVGSIITVTANYTDDDGFAESPTSAATVVVVAVGANAPGSVVISGDLLVGSLLTATITDGNTAVTPTYQWQADAVNIAGANGSTFTPTALERGKIITVNTSYTDGDGYAEAPTADTSDVIYSFIVSGETTLNAALAGAVDGDWIGLADAAGGDDYEDMAEQTIATDNLRITKTVGSTAVITGATCIVFDSSTTGIIMDGLEFDELTLRNGDSCLTAGRDSSLVLDGSANILRNSQFLGEVAVRDVTVFGADDEFHYMTVRGTDNIVERNLFTGMITLNNFEGAAISMYISGSNARNIVQYNLFKDFGDKVSGARDSSGFAVQVGRSSSGDALIQGDLVVQYNRFDNVNTNRRLIMVQGTGNTIHANTIVNSLGNVALENGHSNTVSENIIISSAELSEDSGISFAPLGHTIIDNYIGNVTATSADRAGFHIDSDPLDASSSTTIIGDGTIDKTVTVARNTLINNDRAVQFESGSSQCDLMDPVGGYLLDFDDMLIANQSSGLNIFGTNSGDGDTAIHDAGYIADGCTMNAASTFDDVHIYSETLSESGNFFDSATAAAAGTGNIGVDFSEDGATLTVPDTNLLVEGTGADAGIGVDIDILDFIDEADVGPNSTWVHL